MAVGNPTSGSPSPPVGRIRWFIRRASRARVLFAAYLRGVLLAMFPGVWFARVGRGSKFFGWPRVPYWGGAIQIGRSASIGTRVYFLVAPDGRIIIHDGVAINDFCFLTSQSSIEIESGVAIAEFVSIRDYDHEFDGYTPVRYLGYKSAPIRIERNAWIGRGVMIAKGVTIGEGAVVGANSVVTRDIPPHSVAAGAPARVIRDLRRDKESTDPVADEPT